MAEPHIPVRMKRLCCPICSEVLRKPATIPCGHNFCTRCIQDQWDHDEGNDYPCSCPECGHSFPSRPQLIKNTTLADLVRDSEKRDPSSDRREVSAQALKRPLSWTETGIPLCWRHSSSLDVYCCTDEQIICAVCASAEHTGHTIGSVKGERNRKQEELKNILMKSKQILKKHEKKWKNLEKTLQQIQEEARSTENYCESVLASSIDSLQRHFLSVRELIGAQEEAAAAQLQICRQTLPVKMEEMRKWSAELERLAQTDNDTHFLQKWSSLRQLCEEDHLHPVNEVQEDPFYPFRFTKRAVDELERQLEEFCDKTLTSISQTGVPGVNNTLTVEPKTRAEFLQYACAVSLDPDTAHRDLAISVGDKEVRLSPLKCKGPPVRHPEKFIYRRQVLCREGLQAERCYYEVEVEGDKAEIALAYKGIDRKTRTALSAFGGNSNSWSLDRSANYSVSHRGDSIQLKASPSHHRIGVYLRFKEGLLSFYEVSDSMRFLYRAEAKFTEPLYPGFWLGEKCCIRICDLRWN
uniref:tripartite motif-containing protein 16-like protein n=1 Tax=Scatophagus argus TaxID=75038 RepID=UPI001ED7DBB4|nr:tripartite motif-containing protein 16-like protein [Scatophagus argus]